MLEPMLQHAQKMTSIILAKTEFHFDQVRLLMQEYHDAIVVMAGDSDACT